MEHVVTRVVTGVGVGASHELHSLDPRALWHAFWRQPWGFKFACFYLFFEYVRPQSVWRQIDILPYSQTAILAGVLAVVGRSSRAPWIVPSQNFLFIAFSITVLFSSIFAFYPAISLDHWADFLPWMIIYFFLINAVGTREQIFLFLVLFLLCSFKMSQFGFRSWVGNGFGYSSWGVTGAPGYFQNSGEVGIQMCIFLPICLTFYFALRKQISWLKQAVLLLLPLTAVGTILASNSRGAVVGAVAALGWMVVSKRGQLKILLVVAAICAIGYTVLPEQSKDRFRQMGNDDTSQTRLAYWRDGLIMIAEQPVLGVGYFNWIPYYHQRFGEYVQYRLNGVPRARSVEMPHNIFIQAGAELGLLGLSLYLLMIIATFRTNYQTRKLARSQGDDFTEAIAYSFDAAMVGFLVSAQFVSVLYYPYFWVGMPMAIALHTSVAKAGGARNGRYQHPPQGSRQPEPLR
jgi:O-antigen ligase